MERKVGDEDGKGGVLTRMARRGKGLTRGVHGSRHTGIWPTPQLARGKTKHGLRAHALALHA
eukprot:366241-Chlamydomonas_euryale.AAC.7